MPRTLTVIIPCYNEAPTIAQVVKRVRSVVLPAGWTGDIVVVDDGSGQETIQVLKGLEAVAHVVYRPRNGGKGAAVKSGLSAATGDYCFIQDADLELDPEELPNLIAPVIEGRAEAVFGYRVLSGDKDRPALFYGAKLISLLYNLAFFASFRDIPCAYKLFPRSHVPALLAMPSSDFVFDAIEMTRVISRGGSVAQVPVQYYPRTHSDGKKLRALDGLRCAIAVVLLRLGLYHPSLIRELPKIVRFLVAGVAAALVNLATLFLLVEALHVWYLAASVAAFLAGYVVSFLMQKFWTFKNRDLGSTAYQLPLHFALALCNLALNTLLIFLLVEKAHWWYIAAEALAMVIIAVDSFLVSRFIFRK